MMCRAIFILILGFQMVVAPNVVIAGERCIKDASYIERDRGWGQYFGKGVNFVKEAAVGVYHMAADDAEWEKFSLQDRREALIKLKPFFLLELARNSIRLQSYLYCLTSPDHIEPRKIGSKSYSIPMFTANVTCDEMIESTIQLVNKQLRSARINLALADVDSSLARAVEKGDIGSLLDLESQYRLVINEAIEHSLTPISGIGAPSASSTRISLTRSGTDVSFKSAASWGASSEILSRFVSAIAFWSQIRLTTRMWRSSSDSPKISRPSTFIVASIQKSIPDSLTSRVGGGRYFQCRHRNLCSGRLAQCGKSAPHVVILRRIRWIYVGGRRTRDNRQCTRDRQPMVSNRPYMFLCIG